MIKTSKKKKKKFIMLKWVKNNLETKGLGSKKGGVVVMKGKTKKKSPKSENGTSGKNSSETSTAPVTGNSPQLTGTPGKGPPCLPTSKKPHSPRAAPPCPPSMGSRTTPACNTSIGKGLSSQAYHESTDQSPGQNVYHPDDYSYSDEQPYLSDHAESYHPHEMDIAHAQGVELSPHRNSQDPNMTYGQSSSKYDQSKCVSKDSYAPPSGIDHQQFEYDTQSSRNYASSSSPHGNHPSSPYMDDSSAHYSPSSSDRHGPSSSYDHSGPSSPHGHSGPSSPYSHSDPSSPHGHSGPSSPHGRSGPSSPHGRSGPSSPHGRSGPSSPHGHGGPSSPHVDHSSPHGLGVPSSPHGRSGPSSPHGRSGPSSPHGHGGHSSPHGHGGPSSPHVDHSSPHVDHSSPHGLGVPSSPHGHGGHSSPHGHGGHSSPHGHGGHSSPHGGPSSPYGHGDSSSPHGHGDPSSPHGHGGHSSPHGHGGHSSPHGDPSSPYGHGDPSSPHGHVDHSSPHGLGVPSSPHGHGGQSSPHGHVDHSSPHGLGVPSSRHGHGGQSSPHGDPSSPYGHGGHSSPHGHGGPSSPHGDPSSPYGHGDPSSPHGHGGHSSPHGHDDHSSPYGHGHTGPPSSRGCSGPSSPQNLSDYSGPSSPHGHSGQHSSQAYGSPSYASQYTEDQQSPNNCSYSTQGFNNGYEEPFPPQLQNTYVSPPGTPKGHYNPENVDKKRQVSTPLKHVSKGGVPVKKPPRSPKTPISLPLRAREVPSPSIAARALKNSPLEDYTNIVKSVPSKPGPQIPYKERLPKSPKKEMFVTFPDGQMVKQFIDPNMAMMDLLIQLTASKRLNPSGYLLVALSEDGKRPVDYKANQPVGLVNSHRVKLMSKERVKTQQMSQTDKATEKQLPFEGYDYEIYQPGPQLVSPNQMTYRLTVNLPHSQKVVRRMSANHPLYELHQSVCEEKNLDPEIFVFQLPDRPTSQVNLKYTLQDLGLVNYELNLIHRAEMDHYMSVPNLSSTDPTWMNDQSAFKPSTNATYVHMPPPGNSRKKKGFFSFLRKDKRGKSSGDLLNNRDTGGKSRPASMFAPMTDTFESYLKKPKKSSKKKPAPPPPTDNPPATGKMPQDDNTGVPGQQQQLSNCPPSEVLNSGTEQDHQTFQMHSRTNSDPNIHYEQKAPPCKIGTDSITYVEHSDGMNNISKLPSTPHRYLSDIPRQCAPVAADDHPPKRNSSKYVTPVNPQCLSLQLKTADDMYASPMKKRKPAPLPPPGGPQVRPKFDILSSASISAESHSPDTPNTCNLSVSNALDKPNSSTPAPADHTENTNHASRTPLITIKTGHSRSLSKVSTTSSIGTAEEVTFAFDETIAVAEAALQKELMEQMKNAEGEELTETRLVVEQMSRTPKNKKHAAANGSPRPKAYLAQTNDSAESTENDESPDTIISEVTLESNSPRPRKKHSIHSISSDGSFTTVGLSESNSVHITEAEVCNVVKEDMEVKQHGNDFTEIQVQIPQRISQSSVENERIANGKPSVIEVERFEVNGMEIGIEKTATLTKTKIGQQVTVIRPNLETSASLELSRSSSAAELAEYMESPKEELLLSKQDRQGLDYRGSPQVQKKLEDVLKKDSSRQGSPKIMLDGFSLSLDSESEMHSSDVETGPQGNLKKQIERWQMQLQEHLSDNSGLYTPQEQNKLKQKVDQWNKQLKELNVMDTSGFRLLEQNVLKQQIELWQRKLLAKERQYDGRKRFQEQETEFLKRQIAVWNKKIEVIEKCANLYTTEERDILQQQIELWQNQLAKNDNMDIHEKEQNLLKRQIEVWKKNLKEKKFAGHTFSPQEQDILKQQLYVWQKQLQWYNTGDASAKREILREQVDVWQLQLLDVQKNPSEDSKIEQEILEQQIELWQCKLNQKDNLSEDIMLKQIDIWKRQTDSNRKVDDKYLVQEQMIIEKEIQLWNKRLSGEDVECENFIALEQDLLHEKIELCQQKLKNNVEIDSPDMMLEQEMLKLQVDLWQQKLSAMQEKKLAMINYKAEEQDILKFQIKLWENKLIQPSEKNSAVAISERGTELLAQEVDLWQRWLDVKKEKKEACIKFKFLDEELQKEQIRLWQDHLNVIKNDTLGYTEEEREILMQQIQLWQKGLTEKKDGKTIHLAAEQDILKKYIDLWYNKMRRNTASSISEERDDVRKQIEIWKKQLNMYTLDDNPLPHSARQDIINQQINIWQKKRERCSVDADELSRIESEILQQQIQLWQTDLIEYEQVMGSDNKEMPKEQIKLLKRTLSQRKADIDPEILAQEKAIVNRQIDLYQKKLENGHEPDSSDFINDEQKILEQQIDLWHRKLCLPVEGKGFYSESEYDILQKQVSLWHQQLVAIQHRQESLRKLAIQEQTLLKEQITLWEVKLEAFPDPVFMVEEQDAMKDQIELWQQQLEEHKSIILYKTASTPDDPELRKMELMLRSQEEIIQSFKEGLKNLPENLKTRTSSPSVLPPPIPVKEIKPVQKVTVEFPPPPETFSDKEDFTSVRLKQTGPKAPPKPQTPPTISQALANLKKVDPSERPTSPVKDNDKDGVLRAVPAVVLKPAVARKPKRKLPEPVLSPRENLMMEIKGFAGRSKLKGNATYKNEPM